MRSVLVVGESLVDVVARPDGSVVEHPGGSAANVAVALSRLGRPVRFVTSWADDDRGRLLADHLGRAGVGLAVDPLVLRRTSSAQATIAADGSASYVFDLDWRFDDVTAEVVGEPPAFVHVCSIGAVLAPGAAAVLGVLDLLEGLGGDTFVTYDVNARPAITGTGAEVVAATEAVARRAHLVKASDEDLEALWPDLGVTGAARHLCGLGPRAVVVTRGAAGATWFTADDEVSVASEPVVVADTIGAGDTFSAALVDALWDDRDRDPAEALAHAARAAAITVSRPGADPPRRAELG
jgi:fructokinase